mgnify:CR=1 FL=1
MNAAALALPSPTELDEFTLERAKRGDEAAARSLVIRYQRAVHQLLWRMLECSGRGAVVEDLAQETFIRVFRALPRFTADGPARLSSWILTIAARLALNELRKVPRNTELLDEELPARERTDTESERRQLGQAVRRALANLSPEHRAVLLLRDVHELAYEEIAQALELELGTVRSRLSRARAALREELGEDANG